MPVGAGSIKRVAKAAGTETTKEVVTKKLATATKKTTAKTSNSKTTSTTMKVVETKATTIECNEVCHITEELPIHLL